MKFKFGDKVTVKNEDGIGQGIVVAIDANSEDQPYLVLIGEYSEDGSGRNNSDMVWPFLKDLKRGWRK